MTASYATAQRNAKLDAITTFVGNAGLLIIYDGTPPASANAALSGNNVLVTFTMGSPFAPGASGAVLSPTLPSATAAALSGTASFFRQFKADGTTVSVQGTAGTSATDLILDTTSIVSGGLVTVSAFTITAGNA